MNKVEPVTIWSRWDSYNSVWKHNHIEDGHSDSDKPEAKFPNQKADWAKASWQKEHGHLKTSEEYQNPFIVPLTNDLLPGTMGTSTDILC